MTNSDKIVENLERYFQTCMRMDKEWSFLLSVADYTKYVLETPKLSGVISRLLQEKAEDHKELAHYEKQSLKETHKAADSFLKQLYERDVSDPKIEEAVKHCKDCVSGKITGSQSPAELVFDALTNIMSSVFEMGHGELLKDLALIEKVNDREMIREFTFSPSFELRWRAVKLLNNKKKITLWSAWDHLSLLHHVIFRAPEELEILNSTFKKEYDQGKYWHAMSLMGYRKEIEEIQYGDAPPDNLFKKAEYKEHICRLHNHLFVTVHEDLGKLGVKKRAKVLPYGFPKGSTWKDVEIELTSHEYITVTVKGSEPQNFHFSKVGFDDNRRPGKPIKAWAILGALARLHGKIDWNDSMSNLSKRDQDSMEKCIEVLNRNFKSLFGLPTNPICWKTQEKAYVCSFPISASTNVQENLQHSQRYPGQEED